MIIDAVGARLVRFMPYLFIQFSRLIANTSVILRKLFQFILFYHFLNRIGLNFLFTTIYIFFNILTSFTNWWTLDISPECDVTRGF